MKLNQAIEKAKERHKSSVLKNNQRQYDRLITVQGLCRFFNFQFERKDYGVPPVITKKESNMVSGFIRVLKNNNYSDKDIYDIIDKYLMIFETLKGQGMVTTNGKKHTIGARPNLKDLLYCRDDIINKIKVHSSAPKKSRTDVDWTKEVLSDDTEGW